MSRAPEAEGPPSRAHFSCWVPFRASPQPPKWSTVSLSLVCPSFHSALSPPSPVSGSVFTPGLGLPGRGWSWKGTQGEGDAGLGSCGGWAQGETMDLRMGCPAGG